MIINIKQKTGLSGFYIIFKGSTNLESPGNYGVSHLLEHLITKSYEDLSEQFDRDGIDDNAYTSGSEIVFYIKGLDEKVLKWRDVFIERILNYELNEEDFIKEKKIVLEEYHDSFNSQEGSHVLNLERKLFNRFNPIGLKSDIENLTFLECIKFFEKQYLKPSMVINVTSKKFKGEDVVFQEDNILYTDYQYIKDNKDFPLEKSNNYEDKSSINILSKVIDSDFIELRFLSNMLSYGLKSPLYQEIREKSGMAYWVSSYLSKWSDNQGIMYISTSTMNKNVERVIESVIDILKNSKKYITKDRFNIVKDSLMVRKKKSEILIHNNVEYIIDGVDWDLNSKLEKIKYSDLIDIYENWLDPKSVYISIDKKEFKL